MHYCRDCNLLGMLSDLLARTRSACATSYHHGDLPKMGPHPEATAVFDIGLIGLTNPAAAEPGLDPGGNVLASRRRSSSAWVRTWRHGPRL